MNRKLSLIVSVVLVALIGGVGGAAGKIASPGTDTTGGSVAPQHPIDLSANPLNPHSPLSPLGTAFTYQGRLTQSGTPANGQYDIYFYLFDALTGGNQIGYAPIPNQTVTDGLFTVQLDFGLNVFQGDARWLELTVRPAGSGPFTTLSPRQPLTGAPYAIGLMPGAVISGTLGAPLITVSNSSNYSESAAGYFTSTGGYGVKVESGRGVHSVSTNGYGVSGVGNLFAGVYGQSSTGPGVYGTSISGTAVYGAASGSNTAVWGSGNSGTSVLGTTTSGIAVSGLSIGSGYAGYFTGTVQVSGNMTVTGTLTKGAGSFKIDHPLDPAGRYLSHSFVESPDMMDIYNGNATLDANGEAWVEMPGWFEALNKDFRYQLTAIGAPGPNLYVAEEIQGNRFKIAGGKPGSRVSWQVTGVRHDAYADAHRIPVEQDKPAGERGLYLHPELYGQPDSKLIGSATGSQPGTCATPGGGK